jgi:hypothetical protein
VGVWGAARYVYVITGVDVTPLQSLIIFDQHLLRTGKEEEVLGVVVAVHRHRHPGRDNTPHDAEVRVGIVWWDKEFDRWTEDVPHLVGRSVYEAVKSDAVVTLDLHVPVLVRVILNIDL